MCRLFSHGDAGGDRSVGLLLLQGQPVEEPLQLPWADGSRVLVGSLWPAEASAFQASIVEPEAVMVPDQDLEFVFVAIAEDKQAVAEQIEIQDLADDCGQAVDGLSQIGVAASQIDAGAFAQAQHERADSATTTARRV